MADARMLKSLILHNERALGALRRASEGEGAAMFPPDAEEILLESAGWLWTVVDNIGALDDKALRLSPEEKRSRRAVAQEEAARG